MGIIKRRPMTEFHKIVRPSAAVTMGAPDPLAGMSAVDATVNSVALLVYNTVHSYWMSSTDLSETVAARFPLISKALEESPEIRFTLSTDGLMVNGTLVKIDSHHVKAFAAHLAKLNFRAFSLTKGLSLDELGMFIQLVGKPPVEVEQVGGFSNAVRDAGFKNVLARKVSLQEVAEDELVVGKEDVDVVAVEAKKQAESDVLAFLSAEEAEPTQEVQESMNRVARNPSRMAEIVTQATEIRRAAAAGRELTEIDVVKDCLERTCGALMSHPDSKTKKGKQAIRSELKQLETELLAKIGKEGDANPSVVIAQTIEQMTEGLRMATVVTDYTKKMKALEASEKRILRFIKAHALEEERSGEIEAQLREDGLDTSSWHKLLAKTAHEEKVPEAGEADDESHMAISHLASILGRLHEDIEKTSREPRGEAAASDQLAGELAEANDKVRALAESTEKKIQTLVNDVGADLETVDEQERAAKGAGAGPKLSRKKLLEMLAEIGQELCQPLSVISCSVALLGSSRLGTLSPSQAEMLQMAAESTIRMKTLIDGLIRISGMPSTLAPDRSMLGSVCGQS